MSKPRRLVALKRVTKRTRTLRVIATPLLGTLLALSMVFVLPRSDISKDPLALLPALLALVLLLVSHDLWTDALPSDFSTVEQVKYRLDRMSSFLGEYEESYDDSNERIRSARRTRREARLLLRTLSPYEGTVPGAPSDSTVDLFVGELRTFAIMIGEAMPLVSGLVSEGKKVPAEIRDRLWRLAGTLDQSSDRLLDSHVDNLGVILNKAKEARAQPDPFLVTGSYRLILDRLRIGFRSLSMAVWLVLVVLIVALAYSAAILYHPLFQAMSPEGKVGVFFTIMAAIFTGWQLLRS